MRFAGYAALFGTRDAAGDAIRPGAFADTLADRREPLPLFWQHRPDQRIGWVDRVAEDDRGLRVVATIDNPDGIAGRALARGAVTGLSFGYRTRAAQYAQAGRELIAVELFEVSLVTFPLQHGARVHLVEGLPVSVDPGSTRVRFSPPRPLSRRRPHRCALTMARDMPEPDPGRARVDGAGTHDIQHER